MSTNFGNFGLPNSQLRIGNVLDENGQRAAPVVLDPVWFRFLARLSQLVAERPITPVAVGASPFSYTATTIGTLVIDGGTVSLRQLTRGDTTLSMPGSTLPMAAGDVVTVTYTVAPTMNFIPGARA